MHFINEAMVIKSSPMHLVVTCSVQLIVTMTPETENQHQNCLSVSNQHIVNSLISN